MLKRDKYDHLDITGARYGRLTAVEKVGKSTWLFHCDCGNDVTLRYSRILGGQKSCGCLSKECQANFGKSHTTHGESKTKLYRKYRGMITRCHSKSSYEYKRYGGRGITVCDTWLSSYKAFRDWAYSNGYDPDKNGADWSIDRIDNSKGYSPENCRFTTAKEQMRNRDVTTLYEYQGGTYTASEFADKFGIEKTFVYKKAKKGWALSDILAEWNRRHSIPRGYVDTVEYAKLRGVTQTTVNRWIHKGEVKAKRFGRKWYICTTEEG